MPNTATRAYTYPASSGHTRLWEHLQELAEDVDTDVNRLYVPGWTSYTPSWTASGTLPALGNGTITGRYRRPTGSDLIIVEASLVMGSTTTFGTGAWFISAPVTMSSSAVMAGAVLLGDSGTLERMGAVRLENTFDKFIFVTAAGGYVGPTGPHTWASTDTLKFTVLGQPA